MDKDDGNVTEDPQGVDSKPGNRFQVQLVDKSNSPGVPVPEQQQPAGAGDATEQPINGEHAEPSVTNGIVENGHESPKQTKQNNDAAAIASPTQPVPPPEPKSKRALTVHPVAPTRQRHVSIQSNDTNGSIEHDPNVSLTNDTYRKFDTSNLKTFGKNTHEALPHIDFYRQTGSVHHHYKRPTLDELHEEKVSTYLSGMINILR